uniref:putative methylesterase 11, chloroplastic isoform X2 n=1 Tax=Erigeron canadensis TaxID=72917 RepID=UPI001CB98615|nr:putative methylesterase 11, chloroplastic isoform X2 [Erigeron canadensis]
MGICFSKKSTRTTTRRRDTRIYSKRISNNSTSSTSSGSINNSNKCGSSVVNRWSRVRSSSVKFDDRVLHEQAIAAAILFQQHQQQNNSGDFVLPFDRSISLRNYHQSAVGVNSRSSSTIRRRNSLIDNPVVDLEVNHEELETSHIVLIHGGGFGAWCWYKTIALLQECKFEVTAIDSTASGIDRFDANSVKSLSQYVKPLTDFLEKLADGEKVILVGHDFGGVCVSYAMELFPAKVSKAIYIAASMLKSGQSTLDMFSDKDVALASVSMRPIPFAPVLEKLSLSDSNYGSVRRFYIETPEDNAIPISLQQMMIDASPVEKIFRIKGADHCPFFSKPQALHKFLVEIVKIK